MTVTEIEFTDVDNIYKVPLKLAESDVDKVICELLRLPIHDCDLSKWKKLEKIRLY